MKQKTIAFFLLFILLLSVFGCKKPNDGMDLSNSLESATQQSQNSSELTENIITKTEPRLSGNVLILADQSKKNLTYNTTSQISEENIVDVYFDENQNQFRFNHSGKLIGYMRTENGVDTTTNVPVTQAQANIIAREHISNTYGGVIDDYVLDFCNDNGYDYELLYIKKYGVENFIKGDSCLVSVGYDGTICYSSIIHVGRYADFDESLLNDITYEQLQDYADQQIEYLYRDLVNHTVTAIWLRKDENSRYYLSIHIDVEYVANNETISELRSIEYTL